MEIIEQRPGFLVCHQSPTFVRALSLFFAGLGLACVVLMAHASGANVHGSPLIGYLVGGGFVVAGVFMFVNAEDDRIVLDGAAHVARIMRKGLGRQSTTEVPFDSITDVALEVRMASTDGSHGQQFTWRPVFVCQHGRVPWTPIATSDRASQARAVAAARSVGGWNSLPIDGSPALGRAVGSVKNLGCVYAFAAVFIGFLLLITGSQLGPLMTWKPTTATVLGSGVGEHRTSKGTNYSPTVSYRYTVNGTPYTSNRVAPLSEAASRKWAQSIVDRFPAGAVVTAWYNPNSPSDAYIYRHFAMIPFIMMGIMIGVLLFFIAAAKRAQSTTAMSLAGGDVPVVSAR